MVVSKAKDSKRKRRKESPPAQQPTAVESSPEMPKRTKVQAQRKFAQGQSAPTSSYNSVIAASSSSNTGPSTSSESREPPTDILPNKRPKTEDFLTFLCFRGTRELPAHLDFLNQGKPKDPEPIRKPIPKTPKAGKKGKKGKGKAAAKVDVESKASTSTVDQSNTIENDKEVATGAGKKATGANKTNSDNKNTTENTVIPFAVRKRAEIMTEGNRRGRGTERQLRNNAEVDKCNSSPETKRRSNRTSAKDVKLNEEAETDEDDEFYSANDDTVKVDEATTKVNDSKAKVKTPIPQERKSETPSKESEKSRKSRASSAAKRSKEQQKEAAIEKSKEAAAKEPVKVEQPVKEKHPVKRPRQKESPIFIPSPEPSGRMTRQRAFFEPVKVPPRVDEPETKEEEKPVEDVKKEPVKTETKVTNAINEKTTKDDKNQIEDDKNKNMNVFDFSSDDEQPLSKSIKMPKGKSAGSPKKGAPRGRTPKKKTTPTKKEKKDEIVEPEEMPANKIKTPVPEVQAAPIKTEPVSEESAIKQKGKRGKNMKKKATELPAEEVDLLPPSPKKANSRQSRKKIINEKQVVNGEEEKDTSPTAPMRNQRPLRKTKEAATIYMGIISHKLQQPDDEDDDNSLNSFPDLPNVKEMEKREIELKKNAVQTKSAVSPNIVVAANSKPAPSAVSPVTVGDKPAAVRRGRPPKQSKALPVKREIEGMLVKKGALTKIAAQASDAAANKEQPEPNKLVDDDDEDFLINEELNETKRKLEKSFSDSDDEPLAIKAHVKTGDKDFDDQQLEQQQQQQLKPMDFNTQGMVSTTLQLLPLTTKPVPTPPLSAAAMTSSMPPATTNASPISTPQPNLMNASTPNSNNQTPSPFKSIEKKSPIPTSKILNVPATYGVPIAAANVLNAAYNKTSTYLPQPSPLYHTPTHVRPPAAHPFPVTVKSPTVPVPTPAAVPHLTAPLPPQSPLKYQTPPTTYPPPIEAYPSPKINPNFLTPKFDRTTLPRNNNFPSPSPVRFDVSTSTSKAAAANASLIANSTLSPKTPNNNNNNNNNMAANTNTGSAAMSMPSPALPMPNNNNNSNNNNNNSNNSNNNNATGGGNSSDPLKDEIGSILAANLMPSKEESGKIFGIASVSLAQSSGPDNTKCTLGKCGSIHKPVLGPVVPTEGYIGDQLSSKERRKAKVNMTHEQIQKWLIECSSNPDEIQDDLDDDFDDNIRPTIYGSTPPPTRDDKESTSFSSSSKATRDLGKSESAWSAKGPSLKATPVVASSSRKEEAKQQLDVAVNPMDVSGDNEKSNAQAINLTQKSSIATKQQQQQQQQNDGGSKGTLKDKPDKKNDKKAKDERRSETAASHKDNNKANKADEAKSNNAKSNAEQQKQTLDSTTTTQTTPTTGKQNKKKHNTTTATTANVVASNEKSSSANVMSNVLKTPTTAMTTSSGNASTATSGGKTQKRTPVYNQKAPKQVELKESTTTSHRKTAPFSYGAAFSADNEKSIYSFDKDDDDVAKPTFRRQSRQETLDETPQSTATTTTPTSRSSPAKKRAAAAAAERANKDLASASQNSSASVTVSPTENSKLVKVSLDAEKKTPSTGKNARGGNKKTLAEMNANNNNKAGSNKNDATIAAAAAAGGDSDSDGHTFYIPLQGVGAGGAGDADIQGVALTLGREGPDGPNQKVTMHATLVTKAQAPPESMNVSDIVKTLMGSGSATATAAGATEQTQKKTPGTTTTAGNVTPSTSAAAAAALAASAASNKNVPVGTVQPRFKASESVATASTPASAVQATTSAAAGGGGGGSGSGAAAGGPLMRVNSNSSLFSGSAKSRAGGPIAGPLTGSNKKFKDDTPIKMSNNTAFPRHDDPTQMVEAPIFRPTEKEFADPIEFIERITPIAARFGICKIIPPANFKPECRISDEMRFTAYNQYVHKMLHRWGPSAKELSAIKKYLATQSIVMNHPPWIGGMEVDLPRLYHTVQELGGLKEVIEKKKWARVAEDMCIPKLAQDRVTKLDDIYCKYLLPYDTLSPAERQKLFDEVEADWAKREARARRNADRFVNTESVSNEEDDVSSEDDEESEEEVDGVSMECIVKGRSMPLSQFFRIARNTMALWFKHTEPTVTEVEVEFWRHVAVRDSHVCVHAGSIDSSGWGYGFPSPGPKGKGSNYARHPWNLKVLTNNPGSVLRSLGPVMGVTVPTLHVGMLFSACCWYRDPHGLSWIEYLHTGASKLWYGIPDDQSANFRRALTALIPTHCQNKTIWLPCDTVMVPPHMLTDRGVSLCRIEQKPGEFIVVFPRAYTSSLATGYVVSESVYFATTAWLDLAKDDFRDIHDSCEPAMFSLEQLLFALGYDQRVTTDTLQQMLPMLHEVCEKETAAREQLKAAGVTSTEKVPNEKGAKAKKQQPPHKSIESECDLCRANLYISMVKTEEGNVYCLQHALKNLNNGNIQAKQCKLIYAYNVEDIEQLIKNIKDRIQQKRNVVVHKKGNK